MDWTAILQTAGLEDSPGYQETIRDCREHPYVPVKRGKGGKDGCARSKLAKRS